MQITGLHLQNFRNYEDQNIEFCPGTNVFVGDNGQGKTNVLEAIYLTSCASSHRTSRDFELILHNKDFYRVTLGFIHENKSSESISLLYMDAQDNLSKRERQIFHNGFKLDKISDLFGIFNAVIFAPEDVLLVKEGPAKRRRYIDLLLSQVSPLYFRNLQQLQGILKQRNSLLKDIKQNISNNHISLKDVEKIITKKIDIYQFDLSHAAVFSVINLEVWTERLAKIAAEIIYTRRKYIDEIEKIAQKILLEFTDEKEELLLRYKTISFAKNKESIEDIYLNLLKRYENSTIDDIFRGSTSIGPHRDDIDIFLNGQNIKNYASQGQQLSVVLSLKLAELEIIKNERKEKPVLLLDDVMSELDEKRRKKLVEIVKEHQVFITCTEIDQIPFLAPDTKIFQVKEGNIKVLK